MSGQKEVKMNQKDEEITATLKLILKKLDKISKELKSRHRNSALTPMQENVIECIEKISARRKALPTARDIARALGRQESTIYHHLEELEKKKIIGKLSDLKKIKKGRAKKVPISRYFVSKAS